MRDDMGYVIVIIMETIKIILLVMMVVCTISLVQATQNCQPESTTSGSLNSQIIPRTKNGVSCSVCKLVIATVDAILTDAENELAIADALDNVCEVMPNFFVKNVTSWFVPI